MRYLISGYYGEGNLGDEAILAGILQEVAACDPQAEFLVLSFSPEDTQDRHGVQAISTSLRQPVELTRALRWADLLISGGGSILHEADFELYGRHFLLRDGKLRPIPYFLSVVLAAKAQGVPVIWYAQGLGPLHTRSARHLVRFAGEISDVVTFRDRESAALALELGMSRVRVVPDPAYALDPAPAAAARHLLTEHGVPAGYRLLAVCPRPWLDRRGYREHLVAAVGRVARERDLLVLFVPFQERTDGPLCDELVRDARVAERGWRLRGFDRPALLAGLLGQADAAVVMRLHAGILAAAAGTPAVSVVYDPKVASFASQTGQGAFTVDVDELETGPGEERLVKACRETLRDVMGRRSALARTPGPLRREAGVTARLAAALARKRAGIREVALTGGWQAMCGEGEAGGGGSSAQQIEPASGRGMPAPDPSAPGTSPPGNTPE